jgi:tight adherence protein B
MRRMLVLTAGALLCAPGAAQAAIQLRSVDVSGYPRVRVSIVTDRFTAKAPSLTENGQPVVGLRAQNLGAAKSVMLAIDRSRSMAGRSLADAVAAARVFVATKAGADQIAVLAFGSTAVALTGFSTSTTDVDSALRGLGVDSAPGTALYDAVGLAAAALKRSPLPGRVIVILTDGSDVSSGSTVGQAVLAARAAGAVVYTVGIESPDFDPSALEQLARETGGTYHRASSSGALQHVYKSLAAELGRTWRLAYETSARPGDRVALRTSSSGEGSATRSFDVPGASATGARGDSHLPSVAFSAFGTLLLGLLVGIAVLLVALLFLRARQQGWLKERLAPHLGQEPRRQLRRRERLSFLNALFRATETAFSGRRQWRSIQQLLERSGVPLRPAEFIWASLGSGILLGLLFAIGGSATILILAAMALGGVLPYFVISFRVRRRTRAFENQLPDLLMTVAAALKAGHSFKHGLQSVVDEGEPPAATELKRVLTEVALGRPMDDALAGMAERIGSKNFSFVITAVTIQRQVGGSLAGLFDTVAKTVRDRQQFGRKIRSLTAMGRMSAYTLIGVPFFIAGTVSMLNPGYMSPLFHTHTGHMLVVAGLMMMSVGSLLLKKIVSFRG